jgi:hypothetical protein
MMQQGTTPYGLPWTFAEKTQPDETPPPYTPEPWWIDGLGHNRTQLWIRTTDQPIASIRLGADSATDEANVRRIVAAVNACAGLRMTLSILA